MKLYVEVILANADDPYEEVDKTEEATTNLLRDILHYNLRDHGIQLVELTRKAV